MISCEPFILSPNRAIVPPGLQLNQSLNPQPVPIRCTTLFLNQATLCLRATASHTCTCTLSHPTHPTPSCASAKRSLHALGSQKHDVTASHSVLQRPTGHVFHLFPSPQPPPMAYVACTSALHPSLLPKSPGEGGTSSRLLPLADRGWMRSRGGFFGWGGPRWWRGAGYAGGLRRCGSCCAIKYILLVFFFFPNSRWV